MGGLTTYSVLVIVTGVTGIVGCGDEAKDMARLRANPSCASIPDGEAEPYCLLDRAVTLDKRDADGLDLNDVSVLFPLAAGKVRSLISANQVLPRACFDRLPVLVPDMENASLYPQLYAVAVRIDPCFPGDGSVCRDQVRFVIQSVREDGGAVHTEDAALHVFYDVTRADFATMAEHLLESKRGAIAPTAGTLRVHPVLAAATLDSPYARSMINEFVATARRGSLTRVTYIARNGDGGKANVWTFGGFDVDARGKPTPIAMHTAQPPAEAATPPSEVLTINGIVKSLTINGRSGAFDQAAAAEDARALERFFRPIGLASADIAAAYRSAIRLEDPTKHTSENTDCVSCHLATPTRAWLDKNAPKRVASVTEAPFRLSAYSLENVAAATMAQTNAMRAFSYLDSASGPPTPEISQRTINESARVAEYIREHMLAKPR
jgi:hypothetical protein